MMMRFTLMLDPAWGDSDWAGESAIAYPLESREGEAESWRGVTTEGPWNFRPSGSTFNICWRSPNENRGSHWPAQYPCGSSEVTTPSPLFQQSDSWDTGKSTSIVHSCHWGSWGSAKPDRKGVGEQAFVATLSPGHKMRSSYETNEFVKSLIRKLQSYTSYLLEKLAGTLLTSSSTACHWASIKQIYRNCWGLHMTHTTWGC